MNIKEELTCKLCNAIYQNPITLTCCGDNICKHHVEELTSNFSSSKFVCPLCEKDNFNQNLNVNKLILKMVETELHKFEIDSKYKETLTNLKMEFKNLEVILTNPDKYIYDEIDKLKKQVNSDAERSKSEIDEFKRDLIHQLESYEKKFKEEYKANIDMEHYNEFVETSRKQLNEYEKCLNMFSAKNEERDEQRKKSEEIIKFLRPKYSDLKKSLFSNLSIKYKQMENKIPSFFGKLIIKVRFRHKNLFKCINF